MPHDRRTRVGLTAIERLGIIVTIAMLAAIIIPTAAMGTIHPRPLAVTDRPALPTHGEPALRLSLLTDPGASAATLRDGPGHPLALG